MIKKINTIATPYTATAPKTNDVSTLDATEWNNISSAVATAHSKINEVAGLVGEQLDGTPTIKSDDTSGSEKDLLVIGARDLKLEGDRHIDIAAVDSIGIRTSSTTGNNILIQSISENTSVGVGDPNYHTKRGKTKIDAVEIEQKSNGKPIRIYNNRMDQDPSDEEGLLNSDSYIHIEGSELLSLASRGDSWLFANGDQFIEAGGDIEFGFDNRHDPSQPNDPSATLYKSVFLSDLYTMLEHYKQNAGSGLTWHAAA